jgi:hypothetical protein
MGSRILEISKRVLVMEVFCEGTNRAGRFELVPNLRVISGTVMALSGKFL